MSTFLFGNNHLKQMLLDKISNGGDVHTLAFFNKMLNDNEICDWACENRANLHTNFALIF